MPKSIEIDIINMGIACVTEPLLDSVLYAIITPEKSDAMPMVTAGPIVAISGMSFCCCAAGGASTTIFFTSISRMKRGDR